MSQKIFEAESRLQEALHPHCVEDAASGWEIEINALDSHKDLVSFEYAQRAGIQLSLLRYKSATSIEGKHPKGSVAFSFIKTEGSCYLYNRIVAKDEFVFLQENSSFELLVSRPFSIYTIVIENTLFQKYFSGEKQAAFYLRKEKTLCDLEAFFNSSICCLDESCCSTSENHFEIEIVKEFFSFLISQEKEEKKIPFYLQKAKKLLEEHLYDNYTITDLSNEIGVHKRTLQYAFSHYMGFSSKQYLQRLRLNEARKLILTENKNITIAEIAQRLNYTHPGYFSLQYKNFFGETPTQTLKNRCK